VFVCSGKFIKNSGDVKKYLGPGRATAPCRWAF
jgi:hypothetical protein